MKLLVLTPRGLVVLALQLLLRWQRQALPAGLLLTSHWVQILTGLRLLGSVTAQHLDTVRKLLRG